MLKLQGLSAKKSSCPGGRGACPGWSFPGSHVGVGGASSTVSVSGRSWTTGAANEATRPTVHW